MPFNLQIKLAADAAVAEAKKYTAELGKAEKKSIDVGKAGTQALDKVAHDAARASTALTGVARSWSAVNEQLKREHDMLERIHGPMKQLEADMRSLDMLQQKGLLSAKQYADELARIGRNAGLARGNPIDAVSLPGAPKAGPSGYEKFGALAGGAAGPAALGVLGKLAVDADDRWSQLENRLRKFETAGRSSAVILREQIGLSKDLRAQMEDTIEIYDATEGATQDLFLTKKQLLDTTRTLGRAMELDNKSVLQGAQVMETLEYAMSTGMITTRELKGIMKEFPDIADLWTKSLGLSRKEILELASNGKLDIQKLVLAFSDGGQEIDAKWAQRTKTWGERWKSFKDAIGQPINVDATFRQIQWDKFTDGEKLAIEETEKLNQSMKRLDVTMGDINAKLTKATTLLDEKYGASGQFKLGGQAAFGALLLDPKMIDEDAYTREKAMQKFDRGIERWKKGVEQYKAVYDSVRGPQRDFERDVQILNDIFNRGRVSIDEYRVALNKMIDTAGGGEFNAILKAAAGPRASNPNSLASHQRDMEATFSQGDSADLSAGPNLDRDMAAQEKVWRRNRDPITKVTGEYKQLTMATREWNRELERLTNTAGVFDQTLDGFRDGLNSINESINVAAESQKLLEDGFHGLSDVITSFAVKGKADIGGFVETMLTQMTRLMLFQGARALIGGPGGGSIPGFANGGEIGPSGVGTSDTRLLTLRTRPDETVRITTPGQERMMGGGGAPTIINVSDPQQAALAAMNSPQASAVFMNWVVQNASTIRGHITKR